jgi:GxxExxY protein
MIDMIDTEAMTGNYKYAELTERIIKSFYRVYNILGYGFLEKVYENAMIIELQKNGLTVEPQSPIDVFYEEERIGIYFADIIVENKVIVELKACEELSPTHEAQLTNYLRATEIEVGLLLNFGKKPEVKRRVFDNERKLM